MGRPDTDRNSSTAVLDVRGLTATRPDGFALRLGALELGPGDAAAVLGPSGAGKSTLLAAALGHPRPGDPLRADGSVSVLGAPRPPAGSDAWRGVMRSRIAFVPQDARAALDPVREIGAQVADLAGVGADAVAGALARLGVDDPAGIAARFPHQVSGGQARRALLAIALLRRAELCVLDEPSTGLDRARVDDLVAALRALRAGETRTALWIATHDRRLVEALGAEAFRIEGGVVVPGAPEPERWPRAEPAPADAEVVAACEDVGVRSGSTWLVASASLAVRRGENVALLGPSGAGKTTVGRVLAGLVQASCGRVVRPRRPRAVQMLFQDAGGSLTPGRTLRSLCGEFAAADFDVAAEAAALGLGAPHLARTGAELSGGEQRRAALLRALAARPEVLVLDEPTAALDSRTAVRVVETLLAVRARTGAGMLWITHDDDLAAAVAERVVRIEGGRT